MTSRLIVALVVGAALIGGQAFAARREVSISFSGARAARCAKAAESALKRDAGAVGVFLDVKARRVFIEFDAERVKREDLLRVATTAACTARVSPFHVRAHGSEIRIGIGADDAYIHPKSRLTVSLTAPMRVAVSFSVLDRSHATYINDPDRATFMTFPVDAKASRAGKHRVRARVVFFYCDDTICEKRESIVWPTVTIPKR